MQELVTQIWQFISASALVIIGLIIAAITAFGVYFGPRFTAKWQRKQEKQDTNLKTHFEDIEKYIYSKILPYSRSIVVKGLCMWYNDHSKVKNGYPFEIDEGYKSFKIHFREFADELEHLHKKALELNSRLKKIREKIATLVKQGGISFGGVNEQASQIIYDNIFAALNNHYKEIKINNRSNIFERIEESQESGKSGLLYASNWLKDSAIAYGETNENKENCKNIIIKIVTNEELKDKGLEIIRVTDKLADNFKDFAKKLNETIEYTKKYKIGRDFKKEKECPYCQVIFHPKKRRKV